MESLERSQNRGEGKSGEETPGLFQLIYEDWVTMEKDWTRPGFRAMAVYRLGWWREHRRSHFFRRLLWPFYISLYRYVRNHYGISIDYRTTVGRRVYIAHQHGIVTHRHAVIGDDCLIRHSVSIGVASDRTRSEAPRIGRGVEIGVGAVLGGGITVGDGAKIGPNTVVMMDVPAGASVFGNPGRILASPRPVKKQEVEKNLVVQG